MAGNGQALRTGDNNCPAPTSPSYSASPATTGLLPPQRTRLANGSSDMSRLSAMPGQKRPDAVDDLSQLSSISDDIIVSCIRERFMSDNIYTGVGSHALVAVNPHKYVSSNADSVLQKYATDFRNTTDRRESKLPPHVFQLANNAYFHMRRTSQDQSIILHGETGSGKSENRRLAIKTLLDLSVSNPGKKGSKLAAQVPSSEFVLESFGHARTLFNPNASRFGKYTELQFNDRGRLSGIKTLDYYLERNRVSGAPSGERNFHIFYYLVAGATSEERMHLHLSEKTVYRYLGQRGVNNTRNVAVRDEDATRFDQLKMSMKNIGLSKRHVAQMCQLIAAILHLGNLEFMVDRHRNEDAAVVRNTEVLEIAAEFLGVRPTALESSLSYKTKLVKKEVCTVFLDPEGASDNRDDLAKTLYSLLFAWLNEHINQRLCRDDFDTFIGLFDLPGPQNMSSRSNSLDQFCINFANERLHNWVQKRLFESHLADYTAENISNFVPVVSYFDNSECVRLLSNKPGGLIHIMDDQARRAPRKTDQTMVEAFGKRWGNHSSFKVGEIDRSGFPAFIVNHYNGSVNYSSEGFLERNLDALNPDFLSLLRGDPMHSSDSTTEGSGSVNPFVKGLFMGKAIATQVHPRNEGTIVAAQQPVKPMRAPSTRRKNTVKRNATSTLEAIPDEHTKEEEENTSSAALPVVAGEFKAALDTLFETLDQTQAWFVLCINPNDSQLPNQLEGRSVKGQVRSLGLTEISKRSLNVFEVHMTPGEFCERYREPMNDAGVIEGSAEEQVQQTRTAFSFNGADIALGATKVYLSQAAFRRLEDHLRSRDVEEVKRNRIRAAEAEAGLDPRNIMDPYAPYSSPGMDHERSPGGLENEDNPFTMSSAALPLVSNASPFQRADQYDDDAFGELRSLKSGAYDNRSRYDTHDDDVSNYGTESYAPSRNMFQSANQKNQLEKEPLAGEIHEGEVTEEVKETSARRKWVTLCWVLTFWVPNFTLKYLGRMKRMDVRQAWREKLAINIIIWFMCACAVFVIAILGLVICPTQHVYSASELQSHSFQNQPNNVFTSIHGEVFDLSSIANKHYRTINIVPVKSILKYGGTSSDKLFPLQVSALCRGISGSVSAYVTRDSMNNTDENAQYHDFRAWTSDPRADWYFEMMTELRWNNRVGFLGITPEGLSNMASNGRSVAVYNGLIYDVTPYLDNPPQLGRDKNHQAPNDDSEYMAQPVLDLFQTYAGQDITKKLNGLKIDKDTLARQKVCLRNLFTVGMMDNRNSAACQFSTYLLLVLSVIMISVIGFKFIAALNFAAPRAPEDHDKFVICQVPCYTEGDSSLRKTIDSLARLKYDDKRKLILIVCDGMIVGSGNDRPTPRIVLDILGADPNLDPEPLSFVSLGEGAKQHNMGKVYSGLYECSGHVVPYLVIVKIGKPTERSRPGNRGKRDSQMVIMHFLNKVHFNAPMNPLELEIYHQVKNVIGVNPSFYEYLLTVDADTTVDTLSLNRLISGMVHDKKILGVCGETELSNAKQSIITMMQVYEYFISHHMAKAFESLFGSVTCLPGCFTLFRLRTSDTHKPLLISNQMIQDYSENRVDTLHVKNLLHLGEDRYLTTLLLKHFPLYKTQFIRDAHAFTVAPDDWKVLLSQRRRWINSTVHNLAELIFLEQLCGFCCFSMRFVVLIDLLSTLTQPVTVAYIVYLVYLVAGEGKQIPTLSLILIGAIYGLQALIFIFRRKWDMIGWMVFYILAFPVFSFLLPIYSFWRMDDFSWGATRLVLGESGKKLIVHDEGKFDPRSIPLKSWSDYENELWDKESNHSIGSWIPPAKFKGGDGYGDDHTASVYGRETHYEPAPGYQSGRNSPSMAFMQSNQYPPPHSRPPTNYLGVGLPSPRSQDTMDFGGFGSTGAPSDMELDRAVESLLSGADLNSVTKREVRRKLEDRFGIDLTSRKAVINQAIDRVLLRHT